MVKLYIVERFTLTCSIVTIPRQFEVICNPLPTVVGLSAHAQTVQLGTLNISNFPPGNPKDGHVKRPISLPPPPLNPLPIQLVGTGAPKTLS